MDRYQFFDLIPAMPQAKRQKVQWAYWYAEVGHKDQVRDDGVPYLHHVLRVTVILIRYGYTTVDYMVCAPLHDIPEDSNIPLTLLEQTFGPNIARDIFTLSKTYGLEDPLTGVIIKSQKRTLEEYFESIKRRGKRVIIIKSADRLDNLTDLIDPPEGSRWTPEKCIKQVAETRDWILPLTREHDTRLANDLEHLCERVEMKAQQRIATRPQA